jgi:hypothetical protein
MLKKLTTAIFIFILLFASVSRGQYNEMGIVIGAMNYKGELSRHLFNDDFLHPGIGIFYRHNIDRRWCWKISLNYGRISGDDAVAKNAWDRNRNLSFYSNILELSPQIELNFLPYETGNSDYPFTPYVFTGLSIFRFNPKAELNGTTYDLQSLGTEGQGLNGTKKYKKTSFAIPIGGGLKISIGSVGIGLEIGARRTYTDYLDDVSTVYPDLIALASARGPAAALLSDRSIFPLDTALFIPSAQFKQRGNSSDKDWYVFGGITIYWRLSSLLRDICKPFKRRHYT